MAPTATAQPGDGDRPGSRWESAPPWSARQRTIEIERRLPIGKQFLSVLGKSSARLSSAAIQR